MPYHTLTPEIAILLAAIWLIIAGAALMPVLVVLAPVALRAAVRAVVAVVFTYALKWGAIALAAAIAIASATPAPAAAAEMCAPAASSQAAPARACLDMSVAVAFLRVTGESKRPMPVWPLESAAKIYTAYKTYKNGEKVEEAARIAHAALAEVAKVRAETEAGRTFTQQELHVTRTRLEAQAALLEGLERRVSDLEGRTKQLELKTDEVEGIVTRRGCPQLHAWNRTFRRCTPRQ